jgi:hypothetical protein
MTCSIRRLLVTIAACMVLSVALAPVSFAGEDDGTETTGDGGAAGGGAGTGAGGMAKSDGSVVVPFAVAGGGLLFVALAFGAGSLRRRSAER